jgi:CheY-like chemotaxis protein
MTYNKKVILIVEDDPWVLRLMKGLLEIEGFEVFEGADGKNALEVLKERCPDFILIDIFLPGMNGLELLKKIKENKRFESVKRLPSPAWSQEKKFKNLRNRVLTILFQSLLGQKVLLKILTC